MSHAANSQILISLLEGFGYKWCSAIRFEDLVTKKGFTIKCPHTDPKEAAFRFQAWVETDGNDSMSKSVLSLDFIIGILAILFAENVPKSTSNFVHPWSWRISYPTICSIEYTTKMPIRIGEATSGRVASCLSIRWSWAIWSCSTLMFKTQVSQLDHMLHLLNAEML